MPVVRLERSPNTTPRPTAGAFALCSRSHSPGYPLGMRRATIALIAAIAFLTGCARSYTVDLRNLTDQPVTATLAVREPGVTQPRVVRAYVGPLDRRQFSRPKASSTSAATLLVDFQGNVGEPAELPIAPGLTVVNVHRVDDGSTGRIRLEQVR